MATSIPAKRKWVELRIALRRKTLWLIRLDSATSLSLHFSSARQKTHFMFIWTNYVVFHLSLKLHSILDSENPPRKLYVSQRIMLTSSTCSYNGFTNESTIRRTLTRSKVKDPGYWNNRSNYSSSLTSTTYLSWNECSSAYFLVSAGELNSHPHWQSPGGYIRILAKVRVSAPW